MSYYPCPEGGHPSNKKAKRNKVLAWSAGVFMTLAVVGAISGPADPQSTSETPSEVEDLVSLETSQNALGVSFVDYHLHNKGEKEHNYKIVVDVLDSDGARVSQIHLYENDVRPGKEVKGSEHAPGVRNWDEHTVEVSEFKRTRWF